MKYLNAVIALVVSAQCNLAHAVINSPVSPSPSSPTLDLLQVILSLILILGLIIGAAWFAKRFMLSHGQTGATIKILGGANLGGRERVMLLEVADQWIIVGVAPGQVNTLATMPRQTLPNAPNNAQPAAFATWLKQKMDKHHE
jgi:flagellar protein FliO/FliZ